MNENRGLKGPTAHTPFPPAAFSPLTAVAYAFFLNLRHLSRFRRLDKEPYRATGTGTGTGAGTGSGAGTGTGTGYRSSAAVGNPQSNTFTEP